MEKFSMARGVIQYPQRKHVKGFGKDPGGAESDIFFDYKIGKFVVDCYFDGVRQNQYCRAFAEQADAWVFARSFIKFYK